MPAPVDELSELTLTNGRAWIPGIFQRYDVIACTGQVRVQGRYWGVPSPADTNYTTTGTLTFSDDAWRKLLAENLWREASSEELRWLPESLRGRPVLTAPELNESLQENELFARGAFFRDPADDTSRKLHFSGEDGK